ncbi:MAG: glycine zipper 2TM domain-containing protein [Caulobacteraceae bacterium]
MTSQMNILKLAAVAAVSLTMVAQASPSMASEKGRNTLLGAGAGAAGGALLTHGSMGGTLAGAAVGGLIGNSTGHHHRNYRRHR